MSAPPRWRVRKDRDPFGPYRRAYPWMVSRRRRDNQFQVMFRASTCQAAIDLIEIYRKGKAGAYRGPG